MMKNKKSVFLQIVPVKLKNQADLTIETYALLDSGSQSTVNTKSMCQRLNLPGRMKKVKFGTIKNDEIIPAKIVNLKATSIDDQFSLQLNSVYSIDDNLFNVPDQAVPISLEDKSVYLKDISFQC